MPQWQPPEIFRHTTKRGLTVSGFAELDNLQLHTIRKAANEVLLLEDGTTKTTFHPIELPYQIVVQWLTHDGSHWDLTNVRGKPLDNHIAANVVKYMHPDDFEELQDVLFEQFSYRVFGLSEDAIEELKAEREAAIEEDRNMEIPTPKPRLARGIEDDIDDEDEDDQSAEGNPSPGTTGRTTKKSA